MKQLTCIVPCYERPQRTIRVVENIIAQDFKKDWEAIFIGDGCPYFQKYLEDGTFKKYSDEYIGKLTFLNLEKNYGGWGTMARKEGLNRASGMYTCFLDNDDVILPTHFSNYYEFISERPELDWAYFNTFIEPYKKERNTYVGPCAIGHSEIIAKTTILRKEYSLDYEYGHDWNLIKKLSERNYKYDKCKNSPTYIIKGVLYDREEGID